MVVVDIVPYGKGNIIHMHVNKRTGPSVTWVKRKPNNKPQNKERHEINVSRIEKPRGRRRRRGKKNKKSEKRRTKRGRGVIEIFLKNCTSI